MSAAQVETVRDVAAAAVESAGLILEDVSITSAGRRRVVKVVVDLPADQTGGVPMDSVAQATQSLSAALDEGEVLGQQPYTLEVTSPGAERPLTERRHWMRARGRLVAVKPTEPGGQTVRGRLQEVTDAGIVLVDPSADADSAAVSMSWDAIAGGRVELDFSGGGA